MEESWKLSSDDTMRHLRALSQSPGEFKWRTELLATLQSMRTQTEINQRNVLQTLSKIQNDISHLTPIKLAKLIKAEIEESKKEEDSGKWRTTVKWALGHLATALFTGFMIYIGLKR